MGVEEPTGAAGAEALEGPPAHLASSGEELGPGEYVVVLKRQNTTSIGMRLVQKRYDDLPTINEIDKDGPASQTEIQVDDVLLLVNGVDARASHEDLKRALGSKRDAVLKLRRPYISVLRPP